MADYRDELIELLAQVSTGLINNHKIEFKNNFGAVAGFVDGQIFISCGKFGMALRLPPEILKELFKDKDVKPLKYFPKGHVKKEYAVLPKRILDNLGRINNLVNESIKYVL